MSWVNERATYYNNIRYGPMQEPWPSIIGNKPNSNIIIQTTGRHYITANRVLIVVDAATRATHDIKGMLV